MINSDDTTPATKLDVRNIVLETTDPKFKSIDQRFEQIDARFEQVDQQFKEVRLEIKQEGEETRRHFDVVAEQLFHDLAGASKDEAEVIKDKQRSHSRRLGRLERVVGIAV